MYLVTSLHVNRTGRETKPETQFSPYWNFTHRVTPLIYIYVYIYTMLKAETLIRNFSFSPVQSYYSIVSHGVCHKHWAQSLL